MADQVARLAVSYVESLPAEQRGDVKKVTLVWDVPVNSTFHGTGAKLEGSDRVTLLVHVLPKPVEPPPQVRQGPEDAAERVVPVSSLKL
jgi:hypothetical protein